MYLIVDKKTKEILYMCNSFPGEEKKPEEIFPSFDPKTMEFGRSPEQYIPVNFTIRDGVVEDATPAPQAATAPRETIAQARERMLLAFSEETLAKRRALVSDLQLMNAGIGLYDEERMQAVRATTQAFREEYQRLEAAVAKARSFKDLEAITPSYPTEIITTKPKPVKSKSK
jgi:hypothetical protein